MPPKLFLFLNKLAQLNCHFLNKVFENCTPCWYFAALSVKQAPWSK